MRKILMVFIIFALIFTSAVGCKQRDDVNCYNINIDTVEGLWNIVNWERYENGKLVVSTFEYTPAGTQNTKHQQFLDLMFYADGSCRQFYKELNYTLTGETLYLYSILNWNFDSDTKTITLSNNNIEAQGLGLATTRLKIIHYDKGEFILEGLQPTPYSLTNVYYRFYGRIGTAKERAEYEERYVSEDEFEE